MIKIALCDDNELQTELLTDVIHEYALECKLKVSIERFSDAETLLKTVDEKGFFDLYMLDMILPGMNGLELAATLRFMKDHGKIIFLTSTVDYAVDSYDVGAFYYMLKPVDVEKVKRVVNGAIREILGSGKLIVTIKSRSGSYKVAVEEIEYVDICDRCPVYHMRDGRKISGSSIRGSFKDSVKKVLACDDFYLCGVSLLVNTKYVDAFDTESVLLTDGVRLYPAKSGISGLKKYIKTRHCI